MHATTLIHFFLALAATAKPIIPDRPTDVVVHETRDVNALGLVTRTDLEDGDSSKCPKAILIYARGSTEPGNIGITVGPVLVAAMQLAIPDIWIQGVGGPYTADLLANFLPEGTNAASINEAKRLFQMSHAKCPDTPVVTAGYSQGAVVVGYALSKLDGATQKQVVGTALFGYTKNKQLGGRIPNFPIDRTRVFCLPTDIVCDGALFVLPAHFLYGVDAAIPAPQFLLGQIQKLG
ncbi:Ff.00g042490.m01.CDS01 [Fusarium sp. VM40]|nr:Ff.00g042490.m01.CDS01 [Fusarium sp. VM40]